VYHCIHNNTNGYHNDCGTSKGMNNRREHESSITNVIPLAMMRLIPKAEIHRHLDGSFRLETILDLAKRDNIILPCENSVEKLRELIVVPEECPSLEDYLRAFQYTCAVSQTEYALTRVMYEACEDAYLDGVRYIEIRFAPNLHTLKDLTPERVLQAVIAGAKLAHQNFPLFYARIIVCGIRSKDVNIVNEMAKIAVKYKNEGVVAFDIAGPEVGFVPSQFKDAFAMIHKELLCSTIHAGEAGDHSYVEEAIYVCGANRIGHGVNMKNNPSLVAHVLERQIPVEICVTSNLQTKAVKSIVEHPLPDYYKGGLLVVPCTDNTLMSDITLSQEYVKIQKSFNFDKEDILKMVDNSFKAAFVDDNLKEELRVDSQRIARELLENYEREIITSMARNNDNL
jgi:adenosine deaminase